MQHGIAQPARKKRIVRQDSVNSSPPVEFLPDSLPDLINSIDDQHTQGRDLDIDTGLTDRRVGEKTKCFEHKSCPYVTSNAAIEFFTSIEGYAL